MPIPLHPDCKKRLIKQLSDVLPEIEIQYNQFLKFSSLEGLLRIDKILPDNIRHELETILYENPLFNFIVDRISKVLDNTRDFKPTVDIIKLVDIDEFKDYQAISEKLIYEFESLPWEYTLFVKLPNQFTKNIRSVFSSSEFIINNNLSIIALVEDHESKYPNFSEPTSSGILGSAIQQSLLPNWNKDSLYLKHTISGYIGHFEYSGSISEFEFLVRSLCGFGLVAGLFAINTDAYSVIRNRTPIMVYRNLNDVCEVQRHRNFSIEFSQGFESLDIPNWLLDKEYEAFRDGIINSRLNNLSTDFQVVANHEPLIRAAQWYFDSYCGYNELLSFIQATTVLEILLGDKAMTDIIGLGELLRNRCAYLIGKSRNERQEIIDNFKRIYNTRSEIVHQGKNRLNISEKADLNLLRVLCLRVITEEIKLLSADKEKQ